MDDFSKKLVYVDGLQLAETNYREYGLEVAKGRAYPNVKDGCKSSYKRVIYGMWKDGGRQQQKVAKLASYALPYHPHPTSISGVIVQLGDGGNKLKLMETQGNWGNSAMGVVASADRYIGGRISNLALELFCEDVEYCNYITGEIDEQEPEALPALIPLCFINGQSGIPSGLPKLGIPTLNLVEMIDYYLDVLSHKDTTYKPKKLPSPNLEIDVLSTRKEWDNILLTGKGQIRVAPVMELSDNKITITQLPSSKDVESVRKIVENEILADKIDFIDQSTDRLLVVIEKVYKKQCDMKQLFDKLYKKLQTTESYNMAFFDSETIYVPCSFATVVRENLNYLIQTQSTRIEKQLSEISTKIKILEIIEEIKKQKLVYEFVDLDFNSSCSYLMNKFSIEESLAKQVLQKPISYLTKEHSKELNDLSDQFSILQTDQKDIFEVLIRRYKSLRQSIQKISFKPTRFLHS